MSKIHAVALTLAILAAPAMAQDFPPQDLNVNMTVDPMASLWHAKNIGAIDLVASDAAPYYGITVPMATIGNSDFTVSLEVFANTMPEDVKLYVVTDADKGLWESESVAVSGVTAPENTGGYRIWNPLWPESTIADNFALFGTDANARTFQVSQSGDFYNVGDAPEQQIFAYDYSVTGGAIDRIENLFCLYSGGTMPPMDTVGGFAEAIFTITGPN